MKRFLPAMFMALTACSQAKNQPQINTLDELKSYVSQTDKPICNLDITTLQASQAQPLKDELKDYLAFEVSGDVEGIREFMRRAALKRRLNVDGKTAEIAKPLYKDIRPQITSNTLDDYIQILTHINARFNEQIARKDSDSDTYNIRFCVLNEVRAATVPAMRRMVLNKIENNNLDTSETIFDLLGYDRYHSDAFHKTVLNYLTSRERIDKLPPIRMAYLHTPQASILDTDPKTADAFWVARDREIDAILNRIDTHTYESPADRLKDMRHIDQTLRNMWQITRNGTNHFVNEAELETFKKGISTRVIRVDEFNTKTLKTMLADRGWFRDDIDGATAANTAWLIAQHADRDPEFQKQVLKKIEAALGNPGVFKRNYAYLYDRVMGQETGANGLENRMQRYGTQGRCMDDGTWQPFKLEDPENIDAIRADVGLGSLEEYKSVFSCGKK